MPNIASLKMQNLFAIPTFLAFSTQKTPTDSTKTAENYVRRNQALLQEVRSSPIPGWRAAYPRYRNTWEADVEMGRAFIFEARGQLQNAEAAYVRAEALKRASLKDVPNWHAPPPKDDIAFWSDGLVRAIARSKMRQGRLAEAEVDARRALLARLSVQGKYHARTPSFIIGLADILIARWAAFPKLRSSYECRLRSRARSPLPTTNRQPLQFWRGWAPVLNLLGRPNEAADVYARYDRAVAGLGFAAPRGRRTGRHAGVSAVCGGPGRCRY